MNALTRILIISILVFFAVVLLLKPTARTDVETSERLREIQKDGLQPKKKKKRLFETNAASENEKVPLTKRLIESLNDFIRPLRRDKPLDKNDREIKKLLSVVNLNISMATFLFLRIAAGVLTAVVLLVIVQVLLDKTFSPANTLLIVSSGFLAGTLLPKTYLQRAAHKRRNEIVSSLTDTIDLIAISVEAGLGYDAAIMTIWQKNKSPAMQELTRTIEDINYGMSRRDAYQSLSARCDVEEVSLFANNMAQADKMGIPIVDILKAQADALRVSRRRRAEAAVLKAPVKMLLPLVFFIFPTILVVLLGPAIINISRYF